MPQESGSAQAVRKEDIVKLANLLSRDAFYARYLMPGGLLESLEELLPSIKSTFRAATELTAQQLDSCLALVAATSHTDYVNSTIGWRPSRKRREMSEAELRYILIHLSEPMSTAASPRASQLAGFLSFMITHDSVPAVPVLYLYEIHLVERLRGYGLGRKLMQLVEQVAQNVGVRKVMLTSFNSNAAVQRFYRRLGYAVDVCSPEDRKTRNGVVKTDYLIMGKDVI